MAKVLNITETQRGGAYVDVIAFLTAMSTTFGNATNATAVLLRSTDAYKDWASSNKKPGRTRKRKAG